MNRYCKGCKHQGFGENDINEVWGFCLKNNKELRDMAFKWLKKINSTFKNQTKLQDDRLPSCQLVQASYMELKGFRCPFYENNL